MENERVDYTDSYYKFKKYDLKRIEALQELTKADCVYADAITKFSKGLTKYAEDLAEFEKDQSLHAELVSASPITKTGDSETSSE